MSWTKKRTKYKERLLAKKGRLEVVEEKVLESEPRVDVYDTEIADDRGTRIGLRLQKPRTDRPTLPVVVILGGIEIGKETLQYLDEEGDVMIVAMGYPGKLSSLEAVRFTTVLRFREAVFEAVRAAILVMDYLSQRPDVDLDRVTLAGYSFGAPFVPCIMSLDKRFKAAAFIYGGGNLKSLIGNYLYEQFGLFSKLLGYLVGSLIRPIEPSLYMAEIAPRPLVMIQGTRDAFFPTENAQSLFKKAKEPKELIWIESDHLERDNKELLQRTVTILREWLIKNGLF